MSKDKKTPLPAGTLVQTTEPNESLRQEWTRHAWESRQWGVVGTIVANHGAHGLSYEVKHPDGSIGHYDPSELKEVSEQDKKLSEWSRRWDDMMRMIHEEGLYQVMGLMYYGANPFLLAQALHVSEEEARKQALRVIEIISQHEPPEFITK